MVVGGDEGLGVKEIEAAMRAVMVEHSLMAEHPLMADPTHQDDHEWVQKKRDWEARKKLRVERIRDSLVTWGLQGMALAVFSAFLYYLTGGVKGG